MGPPGLSGTDGPARADAGPLDALAEWPVDHVAAAVVTAEGVRWAWGDQDHRFALASVSKPLTAYAVLVAVEEETLALDQPAGPSDATIAHLLSHSSGLALDGGVIAQPGKRRIYSNAGFDVLGQTLAEHTSLGIERYLAEAVLDPLGMTATSLDGSPATAVTSTVDDLARFAAELLDPQILAAETHRRATTVAFAGLEGLVPGYGKQSPNDWGLGFEVRGHKAPHWTGSGNDPATFGHFGRSGTFVWIDPAVGAALVVLTDREFEAWAKARWPPLADRVIDAVVGSPNPGPGRSVDLTPGGGPTDGKR